MKLFFSGWQATNHERELAVINTGAIKHRCFSYGIIEKLPGMYVKHYVPNMREAYALAQEKGIGIMMDSGAFSYRAWAANMSHQGKTTSALPEDLFIKSYVDYCKANSSKWDFYFTLDLEVNSERIFTRHCQLEKLGIRPAPVVHGDDNVVDYLKRYADRGYTFVGIGMGKLRSNKIAICRFLDAIFNEGEKLKLDFHGLALTSVYQMVGYKFFSVDSSSWSRVASTGVILAFDEIKGRMNTFHISTRDSIPDNQLSGVMLGRVMEFVTNRGFELGKLQEDYTERHKFNALEMMRLTDFATKKHSDSGGGKWKLLF